MLSYGGWMQNYSGLGWMPHWQDDGSWGSVYWPAHRDVLIRAAVLCGAAK